MVWSQVQGICSAKMDNKLMNFILKKILDLTYKNPDMVKALRPTASTIQATAILGFSKWDVSIKKAIWITNPKQMKVLLTCRVVMTLVSCNRSAAYPEKAIRQIIMR